MGRVEFVVCKFWSSGCGEKSCEGWYFWGIASASLCAWDFPKERAFPLCMMEDPTIYELRFE